MALDEIKSTAALIYDEFIQNAGVFTTTCLQMLLLDLLVAV